MIKKYFALRPVFYLWIFCSVLLYSNVAYAFGLTIEDIMEREGISRTDRVSDIRKLILDSLNLEVILPWENTSPNLDEIIGIDAFQDIWDAYKQVESTYDTIENKYRSSSSSTKNLVDGLERLDIVSTEYSREIQNTDVTNFNEYIETDDVTGKKTVNLYQAAKDKAEELWSGEGQETMRTIGAALQPFASANAAIGSTNVENAYEIAYRQKAVADYAVKAGQDLIQNIIKDIAEANLLASKIKKEGRLLNNNYMEAFSSNKDSLASEGGAWRAAASGYTVLSKLKLERDVLNTNIYRMFAIRFRIKAYTALTQVYDYAKFCHVALTLNSVIR